MVKHKIIVRPESSNLWWGIYGFCSKVGWEDLNLFYENEERIGGVCLQTKAYLRAGLKDLRRVSSERAFVRAIEQFLDDNQCHYWYYYDEKDDENFYEVPYNAPRNDKGLKPRFMDIWHPDEEIGIATIKSAVGEFATTFLGLPTCEVEIQNVESIEESIKSFQEYEKLFGGDTPVQVGFTDEVIATLIKQWGLPKEEVIKKLKESLR